MSVSTHMSDSTKPSVSSGVPFAIAGACQVLLGAAFSIAFAAACCVHAAQPDPQTQPSVSAEDRLNSAQQIIQEAGDDQMRADAMDDAVDAMQALARGDEAQALAWAKESLSIRKRLLDDGDPAISRSYRNVGRSLLKQRRRAEGIVALEEALRRRELAIETQGGSVGAAPVVQILNDLGGDLLDFSDVPQTVIWLEQARDLNRGRPVDIETQRTWQRLVSAYRYTGRNEDSLAASIKALELAEQFYEAGDIEMVDTVSASALALHDAGQFAESKVLAQQAIEAEAGHPDRPADRMAELISNLGRTHERMGEYASAQREFERSLQIHLKSVGRENDKVVNDQLNLGQIAWVLGDLQSARKHLEEAHSIGDLIYPNGSSRHATVLLLLGDINRELGDYDSALANQKAAIAMQLGLGPNPPPHLIGNMYVHLTNTYLKAGQPAAARVEIERALAIFQGKLDDDHFLVISALGFLGTALRDLGELDEAELVFLRLIPIRERTSGANPRHIAGAYANLSEVQARQGKYDLAMDNAIEAVVRKQPHLRNIARSSDQDTALLHSSDLGLGIDLVMTLAAQSKSEKQHRRAWDVLIRSRALVLEEIAVNRRVLNESTSPELVKMRAELRALSSGPTADSASKPSDIAHGPGDRSASQRLEQQIAEKVLAVRQQTALEQTGIDEVLAALEPATSLVAYVRYKDGFDDAATPAYLAFVVSGSNKKVRLIPLGSAKEIDELVAAWRRDFRTEPTSIEGMQRFDRLGGQLRERIWDPVAKVLAPSKNLLLVPDGALQLINVAALPTQDGHYLVEQDAAFHLLSAERELANTWSTAEHGIGLLALGAPDYDLDSHKRSGQPGKQQLAAVDSGLTRGCMGVRGVSFQPLPGAHDELVTIAALWDAGTVTTLEGAAATESAFKQQAGKFRVLHLATHGFFLDDACSQDSPDGTRGVGSLSAQGGAKLDRVVLPLEKSGLALAGANRRERRSDQSEDGILTAEEIALLDLRGVEWAVLSACDTGIGSVQDGEGVLGMRRAFHLAGAQTIIMSLQPVRDEVAKDWMRALYEARLKSDLGTAASVRSANLELLNKRREGDLNTHPAYWASFVASGNWH